MIVLYKGSRGKGKTLTMVKDAYFYYKNGFKILSNFNLKFGDKITGEQVLDLNKHSGIRNCVLVLDEIQIFFDSRSWMSKTSKAFSNFVQQIRKRNIIILCTTQYANTIDLRLRQHLDVVAYPMFDINTELCTVYYFDLTILEDDYSPRLLSPNAVVFNAKEVYDLYDTYEMLV